MHSSTVITLLSAALTVASPLHHLHHEKRALVTEWVKEVVVVTVTANKNAAVFSEPPKKQQNAQNTRVVVITQAAPPPAAVVTVPSAAPEPVKVEPVKVEPVKVEPVKVEPAKVETPKVDPPKVEEAPKPSSAVTAPTDYATTATFNHNQHRQNHTAGDLAWNQTLADYAATTAKTCVFAHDMAQGTGHYGQNIAAYGGSSGVPDPKKALANSITEMWYYGEVNQFPFGVASPSTDNVPWLHFSQVAWKDTESVGCATQECAPSTVLGPKANYKALYTVCNYFPAGNMKGSFDKQVTKSTGLVGALQAAI